MPKVFISYAHEDEEWKGRLVAHLRAARPGLEIWEDRQIAAGCDWKSKIRQALEVAQVAVLLVSAYSLASEFILEEEVPRILRRRRDDELQLIPVIVRPCPWDLVDWLKPIQLRPKDGVSLLDLQKQGEAGVDQALAEIARETVELLARAARRRTRGPARPASKKVSLRRLPRTGKHLFGRSRELQALGRAWEEPSIHIVVLVAMAGMGKTALVNDWLSTLATDGYRGANRVFGWSFHSPRSEEQPGSAYSFVYESLEWFGDPDPAAGSPTDQGDRLAAWVGAERNLLVLDSLEALQHPPGEQEGELRDQAMSAFLLGLAEESSGLCVVTTRLPIVELERYEGRTVRRIDLGPLSLKAGEELLRAQEIAGTKRQLHEATKDLGGHPLALIVLGGYLRRVLNGDIGRRDEVEGLSEEILDPGGQVRRVMVSYEEWFKEGLELAILRLMGLFNRQAEQGALQALRAGPPIHGLTDTLQGVTDHQWRQAVFKLRQASLLAPPNPHYPGALDAHSLLRQHFSLRLRSDSPDAWSKANLRLFEYYQKAAPSYPETLDEMVPLYAAVRHGCQAECYEAALNRVFKARIARQDRFYSANILGAFGPDLAALAGFFASRWSEPVSSLSKADAVWVLNAAGYYLRSLGRLTEAVEPMTAGLEGDLALKNWPNAAIAAGNLSQLFQALGGLERAREYARQAVELADRSGETHQRMSQRCHLANALHKLGALHEAEELFVEAEELQAEDDEEYPRLYSVWGFRFCTLLLALGRFQEVEERARQTLGWAEQAGLGHLSSALDHLSLGRASLSGQRFEQAGEHLNRALLGLRKAGSSEHLVLGLLGRAELHREVGSFREAELDLREAVEIAERGSMRLHQSDCHLQYARLYREMGREPEARESFATARGMIREMKYRRREPEIQELDRALGRRVRRRE